MVVTILLAVVSLAAVGVTLAALIWLHAVPTGLNPVSAAVSQYGISNHRGGYRVATIALGVAALALGVSLLLAVQPANVIGFVFLVLFGIARLVISWAPMDEPGAARTGTGRAHNVLATVFFASATVAAFLFSGSFAGDPAFAPNAEISIVVAWAMAVASVFTVAATVVGPLKRVFGLAERLLYVTVLTWMIVAGIAVIEAAAAG